MSAARRVSVIVPTYNRPDFLRQALASIRALAGDDLALEVLVGDNGSAPETAEIASAFGARHIPAAERRGASVARNAALDAASGDFIAFLDDDDAWLPTHLRPHLAFLDAQPELDAVLGQAVGADYGLRRIGEPWPQEFPCERDAIVRTMLSGFFPQIGTLVARAPAARATGRFDETLIGGQDLDWMLRLARRRRLGFTPTESILFRARPPGSFDRLNRRRVGFDRTVFFRHAAPEWRIWGSPRAFLSAYEKTLWSFYLYFAEAALERARRGEREAALRAIADAAAVFPLKAAAHLIADRPLRKALALALHPRPAEAVERAGP